MLAIINAVAVVVLGITPVYWMISDVVTSSHYSPVISEEEDWSLYHSDAYDEYADEFTKLFNSYETKRAKNGALMIRQGNSGSYRFAKKG